MSKYQLCKSKLHRPLEKWNLNFHFRLRIYAANLFARMFSAVYNYEMNCRLVFRTGESRESFLEYAALAAGNLILDNMILGILVRGGIPLYVAKVMTECTMFLFSWIMQHQIIFRKRGKQYGMGV